MPKLKLFRGVDPLESNAIPFPRARRPGERFTLRLTDSVDAIREAEGAFDRVQDRLNDAFALFAGDPFDDEGPRAA